jgi:hypothetical protein
MGTSCHTASKMWKQVTVTSLPLYRYNSLINGTETAGCEVTMCYLQTNRNICKADSANINQIVFNKQVPWTHTEVSLKI